MKIGSVSLPSPFVIAPMAGMTDTAFRRLVKRHGGCGLVVSEMVSSEGLVRGIDRTLEYAEFTEEERPVSIQIFGGDPAKMAAAAQVVEGMGADIVDVNMGCPVPKIAKHNAGCSLMREPEHAASVISAMTRAVRIPVTVKMRAGWNDTSRNALDLARRVQDSGASAVTIHGRTAEQSYSGFADWNLVAQVAEALSIPVFGSGDLIEPEQIIEKLSPELAASGVDPGQGGSPSRKARSISGVLVGRGVLRNPWILAQAADIAAGRPPRMVSIETRGRFLLDYIELLLDERCGEAEGFRHVAPSTGEASPPQPAARGRERWVINKVRALAAWYSKGFDNGSHFRTRVNGCQSITELRDIVAEFFTDRAESAASTALTSRKAASRPVSRPRHGFPR
jgi:tRNA-dihydrouridine synthase B